MLEPGTLKAISDFIAQVGFPGFIASALLYLWSKAQSENQKALEALTTEFRLLRYAMEGKLTEEQRTKEK